ncbi:p-cumate dioxygenase [Pueribacillus theae]|uniref:p-cumate dioxygenase n=1 Tax=Pueribacillus theae TaxID=2171751 RepID=A0A2U1K449_9BACI|nr:aromatic-ring-hydroxylating dioxygenase subunit beta [Pueribacillus theae]PWA11964.1 p-cumate dioxygenase [Pueribacillus theae]
MSDITRLEIEDFLYYEASLLDDWKLEEWASLFTEDALYLVPPTNKLDGDHNVDLFIIADDQYRITQRAKRLLKKEAHVEYPHSRTRHLISNVRIKYTRDQVYYVTCNFIIYRSKREIFDNYVGSMEYKIIKQNDELKIQEKRVILDLDALRPQGKISIIL